MIDVSCLISKSINSALIIIIIRKCKKIRIVRFITCQLITQYALIKTVKRINCYVLNVMLLNIMTTLSIVMFFILLTLDKKFEKKI